MVKQLNQLYEFGPFRLNIRERLFLKDGESVLLAPKAFETLVALVQKKGRLVEKEELLKEVWPDSFVEESSLSQNIYMLRKILGNDDNGNRYIETVPRHGYRFVATVKEITVEPEPTTPDQNPESLLYPYEVVPEENKGNGHRVASQPVAADAIPVHGSVRKPKGVFIASIAMLVCALGVASFWILRKPSGVSPTVRSIAVLPFKSIGQESSNDHLGLGMTDAMITKLSSIEKFTIRPTSSIFKYADQSYDLLAAGRELEVEAVLEGTVQRSDDRVRVTVQLINVADGKPIWAEKFDEQFTNIFTVQDAITAQIVEALKLELTVEEKKLLAKRYTNNTEAYESYIRGIYFWNKRTEEGIKQSIAYFEQATRQDPNYALAYAGLADAYGMVGLYGYEKIMKLDDAYQLSKSTALKALQLDETLAEAHISLALVKFRYEHDDPGAEREIKLALMLNPDSALAQHRYAVFLTEHGRINEAYIASKRSYEIEPLSLAYSGYYCTLLYYKREFDAAVQCSQKALEINSSYEQPLLILGLSYAFQGKYQEAIPYLEKLRGMATARTSNVILRSLGYVYALAGRRDDAQRILSELDKLPKHDIEAPYSKALVYAGLGRLDKTFKILKEHSAEWREELVGVKIDPIYDLIRTDPRYAEIVKERFGTAP